MFILELNQEGTGIEIGLFNTIEQGREFISKLDAYTCEEIDGFLYESIQLDKIPEYLELEFNNNIVPFTKFMFVGEGAIDVIWKEIPVLSTKGEGIVPGSTRVDAYSIENREVKAYIEERERKYIKVKNYLEERDFEVSRAYFGSEDGEAVLYRKKNTEDWHFLTHLDPCFTEEMDVKNIIETIE